METGAAKVRREEEEEDEEEEEEEEESSVSMTSFPRQLFPFIS